MDCLKMDRKGALSLETVIMIVLFIAVIAVILIIISTIAGKSTDEMGASVERSGSGAACLIECFKCCGSSRDEYIDCSTITNYNGIDISKCCEDSDPDNPGC
ncbi:MAG: hypothetical protein U9P44_01465 [archaeon]|nr:hypothetical protein [archaeon]